MHIEDKNKFSNVKAILQNEEEMGQLGATHFDCHWKSMESLGMN